jgi:NADPH:quinone reductase-like Zn-dependent oxidoreductase
MRPRFPQPEVFTMSHRPIVLLTLALLPLAGSTAIVQKATGQKAILVTGASSGIGRNITERLAAEGYFVYAGARKDADLAELDAIENVQSVRLDVTVDADIAAAVATVEAGGPGLAEAKGIPAREEEGRELLDWAKRAVG